LVRLYSVTIYAVPGLCLFPQLCPKCVPEISLWTFSRAERPAPTRRTRRCP